MSSNVFTTVARVIGSDKLHNGYGIYIETRCQMQRKFTIVLDLGTKHEIAYAVSARQLSDLCKATGNMSITDTKELHDIDFVIEHTHDRITAIRHISKDRPLSWCERIQLWFKERM